MAPIASVPLVYTTGIGTYILSPLSDPAHLALWAVGSVACVSLFMGTKFLTANEYMPLTGNSNALIKNMQDKCSGGDCAYRTPVLSSAPDLSDMCEKAA